MRGILVLILICLLLAPCKAEAAFHFLQKKQLTATEITEKKLELTEQLLQKKARR